MRSRATRRARYGTVVIPTNAAMTSAAEAKIRDAHTFPESLAILENRAAAKASTNPASARKNRVHTSAPPFSQNRQLRFGDASADFAPFGISFGRSYRQGSTGPRWSQSSWLAESATRASSP